MLRTFSEVELTEMCKKRSPEYRDDILALASKKPDGNYELDTGAEAYFQMRNKYAAAKLPPEYNHEARKQAQSGSAKVTAMAQAKDRLKAVQYEEVYQRGRELIEVLGPASAFAYAYAEFIELERRGGCKSCSRRGQLQKLMMGLKTSIYAASLEKKQQVRELFKDTVFLEIIPMPLKWDDLMK